MKRVVSSRQAEQLIAEVSKLSRGVNSWLEKRDKIIASIPKDPPKYKFWLKPVKWTREQWCAKEDSLFEGNHHKLGDDLARIIENLEQIKNGGILILESADLESIKFAKHLGDL